MECPHCHGELNAGVRFCGHCGKPVARFNWSRMAKAAAVVVGVVGSVAAPFVKNPDLLDKVVTLAGVVAPAPEPVTLQPAGPIVQVPPAILFRGEQGVAGGGPTGPAPEDVARVRRDLAARPNDPKVLNDAGSVLWSAGERAQGTDLLTKAHNAAPADPVISYNLARALYEQGRRDEAVRLAEEAAQRRLEFDEARLLIAAAAVQRQDYDAAQRQLDRLSNRAQAIGLTIQGTIQLFKGQRDAALASFQLAMQLAQRDKSGAGPYNVGLAYQQQGDLTNARAYYQQALGLNPQLAAAHHNLGTVFSAQGNTEAAFEAFHEGAWLDPTNSVFAEGLSTIARGRGDSQDRIVGTWAIQEGSLQLSGTVQGQSLQQSVPMPSGSQMVFSRLGPGKYTAREAMAGLQVTTEFQLQPNGSYSAPAVVPREIAQLLPPGVTDTGTVTFWVRDNTMFGDTRETVSGPDTSVRVSKTWKAHRLDAGGNVTRKSSSPSPKSGPPTASKCSSAVAEQLAVQGRARCAGEARAIVPSPGRGQAYTAWDSAREAFCVCLGLPTPDVPTDNADPGGMLRQMFDPVYDASRCYGGPHRMR